MGLQLEEEVENIEDKENDGGAVGQNQDVCLSHLSIGIGLKRHDGVECCGNDERCGSNSHQ